MRGLVDQLARMAHSRAYTPSRTFFPLALFLSTVACLPLLPPTVHDIDAMRRKTGATPNATHADAFREFPTIPPSVKILCTAKARILPDGAQWEKMT